MRPGRLHTGWEGHLLLLSDVAPAGSAAPAAPEGGAFAAWVARGLRLGEKVVCAEPPAGPRLLEPLLAGEVDVRAASAAGRLEVVPAERFTQVGGPELLVANALDEGYPGVRLAPPELPGRRRLDLEAALTALCRARPVSALCRYERVAGRDGGLDSVVSGHVDGVRTPMLTARRKGDVLAVAGEVDFSNLDVFAAALGAAARSTEFAVWLDVSDLRFMDVAACRALVSTTRRLREAGGALLVVSPLPPVAHVLRLLGVDGLPGIELVPS